MEDTQPTYPLPQGMPDGLQNDDTEPTIGTDIYVHIRLLYDGYLSKAIGKVLESPVIMETQAGQLIQYPSPAEAWRRDADFREWGYRVADVLHRQSVATNTRFNILFFLNSIRNYDGNYQSFSAWCKRNKPDSEPGWMLTAIRHAQSPGDSPTTTKPLKT